MYLSAVGEVVVRRRIEENRSCEVLDEETTLR